MPLQFSTVSFYYSIFISSKTFNVGTTNMFTRYARGPPKADEKLKMDIRKEKTEQKEKRKCRFRGQKVNGKDRQQLCRVFPKAVISDKRQDTLFTLDWIMPTSKIRSLVPFCLIFYLNSRGCNLSWF